MIQEWTPLRFPTSSVCVPVWFQTLWWRAASKVIAKILLNHDEAVFTVWVMSLIYFAWRSKNTRAPPPLLKKNPGVFLHYQLSQESSRGPVCGQAICVCGDAGPAWNTATQGETIVLSSLDLHFWLV